MFRKTQKRKVVLDVNQLVDVTAKGISLVKHGANRSPIKLIKKRRQEGDKMTFNLKDLFTLKKTGTPISEGTQVVSVICRQGDSFTLDAALKILKAEAVQGTEEDGTLTTSLTKEDNQEISVFKLNDDLAIGVVGLEKGFSSWAESSDFMETLLSSGFYPGLRVAQDALYDTVSEIMWKAETGSPPVEEVTNVLKDFTSYVKKLVTTLPVAAFKLEKLEGALVEEKEETSTTPEGLIKEETSTTPETEKVVEAGAPKQVDEPLIKQEGEETTLVTKEMLEGHIAKVMEDLTISLSKSITETVSTLLKKDREQIIGKVTALAGRLEAAEEVVKNVLPIVPEEEGFVKRETPVVKQEDVSFDSILKFEGFEEEPSK